MHPFPGIAEVRVIGDYGYNTVVLILDSIDAGHNVVATLPVRPAGASIPHVWNLHDLFEIKEGVKNLMCDRQLFDLAIWENLADLIECVLPFVEAPEIIHVKKASPVEVFTHAFRFGLAEVQGARFDDIYIRIVKQRGIHDADRAEFLADVDVGKPLYAIHELVIRRRRIRRPAAAESEPAPGCAIH